MAASNKTEIADAKGQDEVDDLFDADDFADIDDLLNAVEEDDSEGWVPTEVGEGIAGIVRKVSETRSDFAKDDDDDAMCPTVTVETKDGTKYRVIGYGAVLKRELRDQDPKVGDRIAIKYFGERLMKKGKFAGKPYKHYGVAVRRAKV
jgi:hypothetical protein